MILTPAPDFNQLADQRRTRTQRVRRTLSHNNATRSPLCIYLKYYISVDPALVVRGEGAAFGLPKERKPSEATQTQLQDGDDNVLASVPPQTPDLTFASAQQSAVFTTPTKRRCISLDRSTTTPRPVSRDAVVTSVVPNQDPPASSEVGFARKFIWNWRH